MFSTLFFLAGGAISKCQVHDLFVTRPIFAQNMSFKKWLFSSLLLSLFKKSVKLNERQKYLSIFSFSSWMHKCRMEFRKYAKKKEREVRDFLKADISKFIAM